MALTPEQQQALYPHRCPSCDEPCDKAELQRDEAGILRCPACRPGQGLSSANVARRFGYS